MSRYIKYQGKLIKFADKILKMAEWVYNEGVYYLRVLAGGGTVANRGFVEDLYKLWEEQGRLDNIKVAILPQAGGVQRTSGIYRFFSKLFTLRTDANDATQTTANYQPYFVNGAMVNPNGASRSMVHPTISFGAGDAWSVSCLFKSNFRLTTSSIFGESETGNTMFATNVNNNQLFAFYNSNNTFATTFVKSNFITGKTILLTLVADGLGNISLYANGVLLSTKTGATNAIFTRLFRGRASNFSEGGIYYHLIQSGALTPTQILEEYNLLRSYIPEIATTLIGTDEIATENCQMVATPMGRVINLNNTAGNVELITNAADREFSSDTGWWTKGGWTISGGTANANGTSTNFGITHNNALTVGKIYKVKWDIVNFVSGSMYLLALLGSGMRHTYIGGTPMNGLGAISWTNAGTFEVYVIATSTQIGFGSYGVANLSIDNVSWEDCGWADAKNIYNSVYAATSGTVAQKTSAALAAAAMWRSPDADIDKQAVFGKIYNGYAAQLLKLDIDAYNAANPSTPWGYHVATLQDFQAIKDTLGGVETAGKKIKINGNEYWTSDNGDNTSGVQALGSGYIDENGEYKDYRAATGFWTVTENGDMLEVVTLRDELDELFITE